MTGAPERYASERTGNQNSNDASGGVRFASTDRLIASDSCGVSGLGHCRLLDCRLPIRCWMLEARFLSSRSVDLQFTTYDLPSKRVRDGPAAEGAEVDEVSAPEDDLEAVNDAVGRGAGAEENGGGGGA